MAHDTGLHRCRVPANGIRLSSYGDLIEWECIQGQEGQIVQSCINLRDFLP